MQTIQSIKTKILLTVKYFLTPKEILFLFFLVLVFFLSTLGVLYELSNYLKVERMVYTGSVSEGMVGFPQVTSPYQSLNQTEKNLSALLFSSLIKNVRIENNEIKYDLGLAEKVETSSDYSTIKVHLLQNAVFSDQSPISTADIVHTLQNIPTEKNWEEEVLDEYTIIFKFKNSRNISDFLTNLETLTFPIISRNESFSGTYTTDLITSGTFKINKLKKDEAGNINYLNLKRHNNGESKLPYLKYYNFYYYNDEASALSDLQTKEINLLSSISGQIISKIKDDPSLKISAPKLSNNFAIFLNQNKNESLRDTEFRQVLSQAIDREALVNQTLGGFAVPEKNILGESGKAETAENLIKKIINDKDNGLFFENGVLYTGQKTSSTSQREVVKISITTINNKELVDTANFVANSWKKLGIEVTIKTIDRSQLQQVVRERDFDTLLFGFSIKKMSDYSSFFHSDERTFPKLNIGNYTNKRADQLLDNLKNEKKISSQQEILSELSKVLENDVPVIILYKPIFIQIVTGKINIVMPEQINSEEGKYKMVPLWFTETEKVLPWFETVSKLKTFVKNMDLFVN